MGSMCISVYYSGSIHSPAVLPVHAVDGVSGPSMPMTTLPDDPPVVVTLNDGANGNLMTSPSPSPTLSLGCDDDDAEDDDGT
jgi:hypothetical protein